MKLKPYLFYITIGAAIGTAAAILTTLIDALKPYL